MENWSDRCSETNVRKAAFGDNLFGVPNHPPTTGTESQIRDDGAFSPNFLLCFCSLYVTNGNLWDGGTDGERNIDKEMNLGE